MKNDFYEKVKEAESRCASKEELMNLLGRSRAKKGMFEGNMDEGELEIGQISAFINEIKPAAEIVKEIMEEYETTRKEFNSDNYLFKIENRN